MYFGSVVSDALVQRVPATPGHATVLLSRYQHDCEGQLGFIQGCRVYTERVRSYRHRLLDHPVLLSPARYGGSRTAALVFCKEHAVIFCTGHTAYRFPPEVQRAAVQSQVVAKTGLVGIVLSAKTRHFSCRPGGTQSPSVTIRTSVPIRPPPFVSLIGLVGLVGLNQSEKKKRAQEQRETRQTRVDEKEGDRRDKSTEGIVGKQSSPQRGKWPEYRSKFFDKQGGPSEYDRFLPLQLAEDRRTRERGTRDGGGEFQGEGKESNQGGVAAGWRR